VFNSQNNNTFTHGFTNTDAPSVANSYLNDVFSTASVADYVTAFNVAIGAGIGIGHLLYYGQPVGEGDYPLFVTNGSYVKGRLFYGGRGVTTTLAALATANIFNMGTEAGAWQVTVLQSDGGIVWRNSSEVFFNGAVSSSVYTKVSSNVSVTVSGSDIVLTNTNVTLSATLSWTVQRMGVT
jgi:hypothetical protein